METAQLILSELSNAESDGKDKNASASPVNASAELRIDRRLREKAYGAQELCRRGMTHEECVEVWRNRRASSSDSRASCNHDFPESGSTSFVPPLETEDDVWYRARSFLEEVLVDASQNGAKDEASASSVPNVLVVAHAGLVRQILKHVVGYERLQAHPRCAFVNDPGNIMSPVHQRFIIPNASLSVLELHARLPTSNSATVSTDFAFWDGPWPTPDVDLAASMTSNTASLLLLNYTDHERGGDD
jgi:broad specificity phosphatase PhoE